MPVAKLLRERTIGETRWAAIDADGLPVALYLDRPHEAARRAVLGERLQARITRLEPALSGAFLDMGPKGEGFLRLKPEESFSEGASVDVDIAAEARRGKRARLRLASTAASPARGADHWRSTLNGGMRAEIEDRPAGDSDVRSAFEDALVAAVNLRGGGRLQIERTEALVAADIDTAGRSARGGRAAASLAINLDAARALAAQIHLRGWGGLAVLDCVSPVQKDAGAQVRQAFLEAFGSISKRQVKALPPSAFGLMEVSADWQITPLCERLLDTDGRPGPDSLALEGLRWLEASARSDRMNRLQLILPAPAFDWLQKSGLEAERLLAATFGARLTIRPGPIVKPQVATDP